MNSYVLLVCALAVLIPLLGVQLPRYTRSGRCAPRERREEGAREKNGTQESIAGSRPRSDPESSSTSSSGFGSGSQSRLTALSSLRSSLQLRMPLQFQLQQSDGPASPESQTPNSNSSAGPSTGPGPSSGSGTTDSAPPKEPSRKKPWDPPFPRREESVRRKESWLALPRTPPRKSGRAMEESGVARRLFPPDVDGEGEGSSETDGKSDSKTDGTVDGNGSGENEDNESAAQETTQSGSTRQSGSQTQAEQQPGSARLTVLWLILGRSLVCYSFWHLRYSSRTAWHGFWYTRPKHGWVRRAGVY